jgi:hypothetical protein
VGSHFARMSKDLDTRAIFCGALDALTFQAPAGGQFWAKMFGWHCFGALFWGRTKRWQTLILT